MQITGHEPTNTNSAEASPQHSRPEHFYRVEGDWEGGGFGYTLAFDSGEQAEQWGRQRARFHPDAVITVTDRGPAQPDLTEAECEAIDTAMHADKQRDGHEQRRIERAGLSLHERQMRRELP